MQTDVSIWLYDLPKCGYYSYRGNNAALFGGTTQTFDALKTWADQKLLGQTTTYIPIDGDEGGGAYFLGMHTGTNGDFLVGIWNRLPGNHNNISSVGLGDTVGNASAAITEIDADRIPGFASYFWIIPSEGRVASIRVKHDQRGLDNFKKYVRGFLASVNPQNILLGPPDPATGEVAVGYRASIADTAPVSGAFPKFSVKSIPLKGDIAYLKAHSSSITKVTCKSTISSQIPRDYSRLEKLLDVTKFFHKPPPLNDDVVIKVEFPIQFTKTQLAETIKAFGDREGSELTTANDDIGFHLTGGDVKWLGKSQPRVTYQVDVIWKDDELVDLASLFGQLVVHRTAVLGLG